MANSTDGQHDLSFDEFDELQRGTIRQSDSIRIMQDNWADEAFVDFGPVVAAKLQASGLQAMADTTDASGVVRIQAPPGSYWIFARYELSLIHI